MKQRPTIYYSVHCKRNGELLTLDIDAENPDEVVYAVAKAFKGRCEPPKDKDGRFRKNVPYTFVKIFRCNKETHQSVTLTHGNVYNYTPKQVLTKIKELMK